jgi:elongation factor Tu
MLELVEMEIRELLSFYQYDGDNASCHPRFCIESLEGEAEVHVEAIMN